MTPPKLRILVIGAGVGGIATARRLSRDGHDVTVFERRPNMKPGGGAVTIWSNGATVLRQLGVDMAGAGALLSTVRVLTSTGRRLATLDLTAIENRLGAPVRMVPRQVLLERLVTGLPDDLIRYNCRARGVADTPDGVRVEFEDGSRADGDVLVGADGLHSTIRGVVGGQPARPTGWCSWQGLVTIPDVVQSRVALMMIGEHGNLGLWPAGDCALQWWFDLPWSADFVRPACPIKMIRSNFTGWSEATDRVLAILTDADLAPSPFPHFRHPITRISQGAVTLLGDAAHTMPPTFAQGTNQALLDAMVLGRALARFRGGDNSRDGDLSRALRWYENTRRRKVKAVSWMTTQQVSRSESMLKPAAMIPDRFMTWALMTFLRWASHHRMSAEISRHLPVLGDNGVGTAVSAEVR